MDSISRLFVNMCFPADDLGFVTLLHAVALVCAGGRVEQRPEGASKW